MPFFFILIIVLIVWGVGALVGSGTSYLVGALIGVVVTLVALAVAGAVAARCHPADRPGVAAHAALGLMTPSPRRSQGFAKRERRVVVGDQQEVRLHAVGTSGTRRARTTACLRGIVR